MYWLDNVLIAPPSEFKPGIRRISRSGRSASARMAIEIIAIKRALSLEYNVLTATEFRHILDILESRAIHTLRHPDPQSATGERSTRVYTGDIDAGGWFRDVITGERCWRDITIGLIEQ